MERLRKNLTSVCLSLFLCFVLMAPAFSFGEYFDDEGKRVSFTRVPNEVASYSKEKELFVESFGDAYKDIPPNQIKAHFNSHADIITWLEGVFDEEINYYKTASHPIEIFEMIKENVLIRLAIIEQWKDEVDTLHIRQMAILPSEQKHRYGTELIEIMKGLPGKKVNRIIADTRKLNDRARQFYKKIGFSELETPHDPELKSTDNYIGLEWVRSPNPYDQVPQTTLAR